MDSTSPTTGPVNQPAMSEGSPIRRPFSVTILAFGVLIITVINLTRFALSLREWTFLASQPGVSPLYLNLSGLAWTVAGPVLVWGLLDAKRWAPRLMQVEALTYALYYWLDLLFLQDHPVSGAGVVLRIVLPTNWLFSALVTTICLAYMAWALGRSKGRAYFGEARSGQSNQGDEPQG
jgi:hypothetical protein